MKSLDVLLLSDVPTLLLLLLRSWYELVFGIGFWALQRISFRAHAAIVHSAWVGPEAKTLTSTSLCAVKKFCQRRPDNYCQSIKRIYQKYFQEDVVPPGERASNLNSSFFSSSSIQQLLFVGMSFFKRGRITQLEWGWLAHNRRSWNIKYGWWGDS